MKNYPRDSALEAELAEMQDDEVDDNGPPCYDPWVAVPKDSAEDRSLDGNNEDDEEDCLWPTDDEEDDNGVVPNIKCEDNSHATEIKIFMQDEHEDPGGTTKDFPEQDDSGNLDARESAATSRGELSSLAVKKQQDDFGGDDPDRPSIWTLRASDGRNQEETNKDINFVEESGCATILNEPIALNSVQDDSEKVEGRLCKKRKDESIGEVTGESQETPDNERGLPPKKTDDEQSLVQKTTDDEQSLAQKTTDDEESLPPKTTDDEQSLPPKTTDDEQSLTPMKPEDEQSLTESVEDETKTCKRQTDQCSPVAFSDTGTGVPPPSIGREDAACARREKLKAVPDRGAEELDPGPSGGDEQLIKDCDAGNTTTEPKEEPSQVAESRNSKQGDNQSRKAAKPWSISNYFHFLVLVAYFPTFGSYKGVAGALTVSPQDVLVPSGSLARLRCSTDYGSPVYWERMLFGTGEQQTVYYGKNGMARIPGDRLSVEEDSTSVRYDLVISNVQPEDAGTYICIDEAGIGEGYRAELVVLERFTCEMTIPRNGVMGENIFDITEEQVKSSCSLDFRGNVVPRFQWTWGRKKTQLVAPTTIDGSTANSFVSFRATHDMNGTSVSCLPSIATDSTSIDASGQWTSEPVYVRYVYMRFGSVGACQSSAMIPTCNPKCTYEMQKTVDDKCRCQAVYDDQGKTYTKTFNEYTCEISVWPRSTVITVTISFAVVVAAIAASVIALYKIKSMRSKKNHSSEVVDLVRASI